MARISDWVGKNSFPEGEEDEMKKCIICGDTIEHGGFWHGEEIIACCHNDAQHLIDFYLDTEKDSGVYKNMSLDEEIAFVCKIVSDKIIKKAKIDEMNTARKAMQKLGFLYYAELGQIDWWELAMSKEDLKHKTANAFYVPGSSGTVTEDDIETCHTVVTKVISEGTGEPPIKIGYFSVPDFSFQGLKICCIAKIDNNGSTFVFSDDKEFLYLLDKNGYGCEIKNAF